MLIVEAMQSSRSVIQNSKDVRVQFLLFTAEADQLAFSALQEVVAFSSAMQAHFAAAVVNSFLCSAPLFVLARLHFG